jgi:dethiobiotin synthetase
LARELEPDCLLLVALDRLGVLHEVLSTARAASPLGLRVHAVALVRPMIPDSSTTRNAPELERCLGPAIVAEVPRLAAEDLAHHPAMDRLVASLDN